MTVSLQRVDQLHKLDTFDDTLSGAAVAGIEGSAVDLSDVFGGMLSQVKRLLHGDDVGNWHDNPESVFGGDASIKALYNRTDPATVLALFNRLNLQDITVGGSDNYVPLDGASEPPTRPIAINATTKGAVVAQLAGAIGSHALTEVAGSNALKPKNLVYIQDGATGDPILSSGRRIYGLLQVGNLATDGNPFATTGNDAAQISFVRPNATYDDLEACPAADIQGKTIIYAYANRNDIVSHAEDEWRGDIDSADPQSGVIVSLDSAYDGGHYMEVDGTDVDIRLADTKSWIFRKGSGGAVLWQVTRNDAGTDTVQVAGAVDLFDCDAADNNFAQGAAFDTNDQAINVGKTAQGVIDSTSLETRATTGNNEVSAPSGNVQFQTVRETTALPLDDATAGAISALAGGPHASVAAAIKYAIQEGGVDITVKVFTSAANYNQGVNIPAATLNLTTYTMDMNTPANTDLFVFLNGRLLHGGNPTTKNDAYEGDTPANGDLKVDFPKGVKTGDVFISIGMQ